MKNKIVIIAVILVLSIAIIGAGVFFMMKFMGGGKEIVVVTEPPIEKLVVQSVDVPELMTNLKAGSYLKISFKLQTDSEEAAAELTQRLYQFNDIVIKEAAGYTAEDLETKEQIVQFEEALLTQINGYMQKGKVTKLFITSKLIS